MSLYQKHRPRTFEEMIGNKEQLLSLQSVVEKKDNHVFLFTGPSGTGKTTVARICADMLRASELSIKEINSANNRGIETARNIIEQMRYVSIDGGNAVFIIDEVHMTSRDFQNAMLKPLEDTAGHVYFFLCTTNPEKLLEAIITRCSRYVFDLLNEKQIVRLLNRINQKEGTEISKDIIRYIANNCGGVPRTAIVLFEKIIGLEEAEAKKIIKGGLGEEDTNIIELCQALISNQTNWPTITGVLKKLESYDAEKIRRAVLGYMGSVLLNKKNNIAAKVIDEFLDPFYDSGKAGLIFACYNSKFL